MLHIRVQGLQLDQQQRSKFRNAVNLDSILL
jgi:hypothetical protein